jgi:hypothetical protein
MIATDSVAAYVAPFANLLPPNARLLVQAGAGDGELARHYRGIYPASSLLAVDADPAGAQQARGYADRVYQADLDSASDAFYRQLEWADGWFFDATLERFEQPQHVLAQVRKVIQYDACVVARVANARHWQAPETPPRHHLELAAVLALFQRGGFRIVNGIMLNPAPPPPDIEAVLRAQAAQAGVAPELMLEAALPSHYLIKAMPA